MGKYRIDLRSDIHTEPTPAMRRAMAEAEVGGDALRGEDTNVAALEEACAAMFGKETALFVASGTMGNLVSLLAISQPGGAIIADPWTHIVSSEGGGFERLAGCRLIPIETNGVLAGGMVRERLRNCDIGHRAGVICVENTHSFRGGVAWGEDVLADLVTVAREYELRLHIDGARIFNAAVASGTSVADLTDGADTVQVCLSKGLGAPFGSLVLGSQEVIDRAREYRQMLGGGIHKGGAMAAAGLVALREMPSRLSEDHRRAKQLAGLVAEMPPLRLAHRVQTNIIDIAFDGELVDGQKFVGYAAEHGVGVAGPWRAPWGEWIRLMTHYGVDDGDVVEAGAVLGEALKESRRAGCVE
ncbi:MAG TPA: GntG family PLP-dependent aldolase [Phycisphaerae bacterium]|nr:GntG family PLP-dependent aldolase [Phycisphaerae bacterium]